MAYRTTYYIIWTDSSDAKKNQNPSVRQNLMGFVFLDL